MPLNLPEGIEFVDYAVATADDFELFGGEILKGARLMAASGLIVQPAKGYQFRPNAQGKYDVVQVFDSTDIKFAFTFNVNNSIDKGAVLDAVEKLKQLPGFVGYTEG